MANKKIRKLTKPKKKARKAKAGGEVKKYLGVKIPRCNGRPQIWSRHDFRGIRIIYHEGYVHWSYYGFCDAEITTDRKLPACTNASTQQQAIINCINHDILKLLSPPQFLGYL